MNEEPLIPQSVEHWTFDQLLARSLEEWKKSLGLPSNIVEANKSEQSTGVSKAIEDHSADINKMVEDTKEGN